MGESKIGSFNPDEMPEWTSTFWNRLNYKSIIAGINDDDCAVLKIGKETVVVTQDFLNANPITLELGIGSYKELGRIMVAANLSDLCGSGALPVSFMVGIMLKKETALQSNFIHFMEGVKYELNKYKIPLVGGDTKLGNSDTFCGIAIGIREKRTKLFLKNGALPLDDIWVSGYIGSVGAAIMGIKSENMSLEWNKWAKKRIIEPRIPLSKSRKIARGKLANSGTDLSDGLGADLFNLCKSSGVGAIIDIEKLPLEKQVQEIASKNKVLAWNYSFTVGGDFQFLITATCENRKKLKEIGLVRIGQITRNKESFILIGDRKIKMPKMGHKDSSSNSFVEELNYMLSNLKEYK